MTAMDHRPTTRQGILITGYYRTGTSALCGALAESGVTVLNNTDANEHNPRGFFEDTALIQLEMDVLAAVGSIWSDVRFLPEGWMERPDIAAYAERLQELLSQKFGTSPLFAVKHPHICRLAPLYLRAFAAIGVEPFAIATHRNPYVVADSQRKKNAIPRAHALLLWASYVIDAERNTRGIPRTLVFYDSLLKDSAGAVGRALGALGITRHTSINGFVTRALHRSVPVTAAGLYRPLELLVADVEEAITHEVEPGVWEELRARVFDFGQFLAEIGETRNRIVSGIGSAIGGHGQGRVAALTRGAHAGHKLRPPERTDEAARMRIMARVEAAAVPSVAVFVVVPKGMAERREATLDLVRGGWRQPDKLVVLEVGGEKDRPTSTAIMCRDDTVLAGELCSRMNAEEGIDYVAVLNAGDRIEPDAIARLALAAGLHGELPALLYCDEIVISGEHQWIRTKPGWDVQRLRESCFVGDWVWYSTKALAAVGGMRGDYPGADEYDLQLRVAERGLSTLRVPEALFTRGPGSRRDSVPLNVAIANAVRAIDAHLERSNVAAKAKAGSFPGTFLLDYEPAGAPMIIGISCEGADVAAVHARAAHVLALMREGDKLVYLTGELTVDDPLAVYLGKVMDEVATTHPNIFVRRKAKCLGDTVCDLASMIEGGCYVAVIDARARPERDDGFDVLRRVLTGVRDAAIAGVRAYYRGGTVTHLRGPLLWGTSARIGSGRDVDNPGPGGWLAATQRVCAVDGPCVVVRKVSEEFVEQIAGITTWSGISRVAAQLGFATLWCPSLKSEIPEPKADDKDPEAEAAASVPYRAELHHPSLSMIGDPILLESRLGLVEESPHDIGNLVSGDPDCHVVSAIRALRSRGLTTASWTPPGVDQYSVSRSVRAGRRWVRINPNYLWEDTASFTAVWTRPPAPSEHKVVKAASCSVATSAPIMRVLAGMGARHMRLVLPILDRPLWEQLAFRKPEKPVALWIDEKIRVPWLVDVINATRGNIAWAVVSDAELALPGNVAKVRRPMFEDGWRDLFASLRPSWLVRPTPSTNWLDDYALLMGAAAHCTIIAGRESFSERVHAAVSVTWLASDKPKLWTEAIRSSREQGTVSGEGIFDQARSFWLGPGYGAGWLDVDAAVCSVRRAEAEAA